MSDTNGFTNIINKWEKNFGYLQNNGTDLIFTTIILITLLIIIFYYYFKSHLPWLKKIWPEQRCNPVFMPFAALVKNPSDQEDASEIVGNNFIHCTKNIFTFFLNIVLAPFQFLFKIVNNIILAIVTTITGVKSLIGNIRSALGDHNSQVMQQLLNTLLPVQGLITNFKDTGNKGVGVMATIIYVFMNLIYLVQSAFLVIIKTVIAILLIVIGIALALAAIWPIGDILAAPWFAIALVIFIIITIIVVALEAIFGSIMYAKVPSVP